MAWIKVTGFAVGNEFCINTDKLLTFRQPPGEAYTALWEPGDVENGRDPRLVKETPDELLGLICHAQPSLVVLSPPTTNQSYAYPLDDDLIENLRDEIRRVREEGEGQ